MNKRLTIYTPQIGTASETFICRHVQDLCPGKTSVVTARQYPPEEAFWTTDNSVFVPQVKGSIFNWRKRFLSDNLNARLETRQIDRDVSNFLREQRTDVILGEYFNHSHRALKIAKSLGLPFFVHAHGYDLSMLYRDPEWRLKYADYRHADGLIVVNQPMKERLLDIDIPEEKIHIIPYGISVPDVLITRQPGLCVRCLAVGRMTGKKDPLALLKSFKLASERFPEIYLDYVGTGPLFDAVQKYIQDEDLTDRVSLHGAVDHKEVIGLLENTDIFVQHSVTDPETGDEEGLPVAILEAMSLALPIVSTRHAGIPEAVVEGETGLLVDEGDVEGMAENILALASDAELRTSMGRESWLQAREKFTWETEKAELGRVLGLF